MNAKAMGGAVAGAAIGGLVGAAAWACLMYFLNVEIGWLAWGVGLLAGLGVAVVVRDERSPATGVIAAVIALGSIALGKYAGVHFLVGDAMSAMQRNGALDVNFTLDDAQLALAGQLVDEYEANGKPLQWPAGMTYDDAERPEHFPPDLWADTQARWNGMSPDAREQYRSQHQESIRSMMASMGGDLRAAIEAEGFKSSFGAMDLLFGALAVLTAFRLGQGGKTE